MGGLSTTSKTYESWSEEVDTVNRVADNFRIIADGQPPVEKMLLHAPLADCCPQVGL